MELHLHPVPIRLSRSSCAECPTRPRHELADLDNRRFATYKVIPFASSSDVTQQWFRVEDRPGRRCEDARVTNVSLTRDFPVTHHSLRGHVTLPVIDG
jgi:hypothetical protein